MRGGGDVRRGQDGGPSAVVLIFIEVAGVDVHGVNELKSVKGSKGERVVLSWVVIDVEAYASRPA